MAVSLEPMMARPAAVPPFSLLEMADQSFERYTRYRKGDVPKTGHAGESSPRNECGSAAVMSTST